jgi:hypothetical protein
LFGGGVEESVRCEIRTKRGPKNILASVVKCSSAVVRTLWKMVRSLLTLAADWWTEIRVLGRVRPSRVWRVVVDVGGVLVGIVVGAMM